MIPGTYGARRALLDLSFSIPIFALGVVLYWWAENELFPDNEFSNVRLLRPNEVRPGEIIDVEYDLTRRRTCHLEISRILRRESDKRDFLIQFVTQTVEKEVGTGAIPGGFRVQIPFEMIPGRYELFSRTRYYCNGLDWLVPRIKRVLSVDLEVTT